MECFKGSKGQIALVSFSILVLVQLALVVGLLVLGIKGKEYMGTQTSVGVPYYAGAILVAAVYILPVIQIIVVIILSSLQKEYWITHCFVVVSCLLNFFGILACILGMIFVVAFGIANCNKKTSNRDHTNLGFCSYSVNTGENYTTAVLSLILIILVFISNFFSFYIFSKYSDALITRKKNNPSQSETDINTVSVATEFSNVVTDEQRRSDVIAQLQVQDLQQRNMDSQCEESILETNIQLPPYPGQTAPPPPYTIQTTELSDFTNPMNHDSLLAESTADLPPSYESVLYHAGTEQVSVIGQS